MPRDDAGLAFILEPHPLCLCLAPGLAAFRLRERVTGARLGGKCGPLGRVRGPLGRGLHRNVRAGAVTAEFRASSLATFAVVTLGSCRAPLMNAVRYNPVAQYLGLISVSLFLDHPAIFDVLGQGGLPTAALPKAILIVAGTVAFMESSRARGGARWVAGGRLSRLKRGGDMKKGRCDRPFPCAPGRGGLFHVKHGQGLKVTRASTPEEMMSPGFAAMGGSGRRITR